MSENATAQPSSINLNEYMDPTNDYLRKIGIWLIIAFIMPIIVQSYGGIRVFFMNIEGTFGGGVPLLLRFEMIYPLLAGLVMLMIAKQVRTTNRAVMILGAGLLPFLILLVDEQIREGIFSMMSNIPGAGMMGIQTLFSFGGVVCILAAAHALRVKPRVKTSINVAVVGAGLYILSLLIPVQGQFSFILPFKMMTFHDPSGTGIMFVSGLFSLVILAIMLYICYLCFKLLQPNTGRETTGNSIISWWIKILLAAGIYIAYIIIISVIKGGGGQLLSIITGIVKFIPWLLGLYLLIPLGVAEFLILGKEE